MAKRKTTPSSPASGGRVVSKQQDKKTLGKISDLGERVVKASLALQEPVVGVPLRTMSNTTFDKKRRILEMGDAQQQRELFNFGQSRKFMQTMLLANGCKDLIEADKTLSLRGMYYKTLHSIPGTKEKTFDSQEESDPILEDLEVSLGSLREELHVFAKKAGTMVGNITTEGAGQPPRGVRRLLRRLHDELKLPVYCLLDCDPRGHYIYSIIKQGSINLAYESERMAVPDAKFLGLRARDYQRCGLSEDVKIKLNDRDIERAKQIAEYPWFKDRKPWQEEIKWLLHGGFKMEVESLITKHISYVTEEYTPQRLKDGDFLD